MTHIKITVGEHEFLARLETEKSPKTCLWFLNLLPYRAHICQGRWSGKASFIRLGSTGAHVAYEKATSYPQVGEVVMYPGDKEQGGGEIYIPYGPNEFSCEFGKISGNHFLSIVEGKDELPELGEHVHWHGAQEILFELVE